MQENTVQALNMLANYAKQINSRNSSEDNKGVGFSADSAVALSPSSIVTVSGLGNFGVNPETPYFSLESEKFVSWKHEISPQEIEKILNKDDYDFVVRAPYGSMVNFFGLNFPEERQRTYVRAIIDYGARIERGHHLALFDEDYTFRHNSSPKKFVIDKHSILQDREISPGIKAYVVMPVWEDEEKVFVNVKKEFVNGWRIGLYETTTGGFMPATDLELYDFDKYPEGRVMNIPFIIKDDTSKLFAPKHFDLNILFYSLLPFKGFNFIDIHMSYDPKKPIKIVGVREKDDYPFVTAIVAPLDPEVRGGVR